MSTRFECWFAPRMIVLSSVIRSPQDCRRGPQRWCVTASSASSVAVAQGSASKYGTLRFTMPPVQFHPPSVMHNSYCAHDPNAIPQTREQAPERESTHLSKRGRH